MKDVYQVIWGVKSSRYYLGIAWGDTGHLNCMFLYYNESTYYHNELKRGKKSILAGQCTVCLKDQNQHFLKKFRAEGP